ncbi:hypothetical protein [Paracoccus shandongensis]|uniref:hypothetical protein n=1 Tax=Paracoccus shandongensis TaxID=2816048 RepID=UPI001A8CB211|nr:hypothetical protein [Paracoccus shandongensis]
MKIDFSFAADTRVTLAASGQTETVDLWSRAHRLLEGHAGRVNVYDQALSSPSSGRAVARADGGTTLNLVEVREAGDIALSMEPDRKAVVRTQRHQKRGHPSGEHYWLPVGANGRFVCEPGQRHRKWYFGRSAGCLTQAQIAAAAKVPAGSVTGAWLLARPQYGGTEGTAIHADLYAAVRSAVAADNAAGRSDHYFLERGYDYSGLDFSGLCGEDELHPVLIGAWGTGADPVVRFVSNFLMLPYCVIQDVQTMRDPTQVTADAVQTWYGYAFAFDHVDIGRALDLQNTSFATVRETTILKAWKDKPSRVTSDGKWLANGNHIAGIYTANAEGILVDSCLIDHTGWVEGYDFNGSATLPHPPSKYSHALYFQTNTFDITVRHNLLSRASSCGVQMRSGLHLEGNLFLDNNLQVAANSFDGKAQFNNVLDNIGYSAGYRRVAYEEGAVDWGFTVNGPGSALMGNVLAHHANPDNAAEIAARPDANHDSYRANSSATTESSAKLYNDTQVWKWGKFPAKNVDGISETTLDQTTIQRRAGNRLGKASGTIAEYVTHVAAAPSIGDIVREDMRWVKDRFGTPIPARTAPAALVFQPDPRIDGFRWDNRRNWSTFDLPGTHVADSVDLAGNFVRFGTVNADIAALKSGGGLLDVTSGRLKIGTLTDAADMIVRLAGQVWLDAAPQPLSLEAVSGRLMLSGAASALDLYAGGQAQALLGPDATVGADQALVVSGQRARVGWDGTGTAALTIAGALEFRRGVEITVDPNAMGPIRYVHRHIGKTVTGSVSGFTARVAAVERITARGTRYRIWLCDVVGQPVPGDTFQVAPKREEDGTDTPNTLTVSAVGASGIAPLQRFRSGVNGTTEPTVTATLTLAPTARIVVPTGLAAGTHDLTGAGVTVANQGAVLPAGVSVTGGKLVLVVS